MTPECCEEKPAAQACMAACCALEPAPLSVPLRSVALLPPAAEEPPLVSLAAPQAVRVNEAASAPVKAMVRVVVLSFTREPFGVTRTSLPGSEIPTKGTLESEDGRVRGSE